MSDWILSTEVKRMLGRSRDNREVLARLELTGELMPIDRQGNRIYYDLADVEAYKARKHRVIEKKQNKVLAYINGEASTWREQ